MRLSERVMNRQFKSWQRRRTNSTQTEQWTFYWVRVWPTWNKCVRVVQGNKKKLALQPTNPQKHGSQAHCPSAICSWADVVALSSLSCIFSLYPTRTLLHAKTHAVLSTARARNKQEKKNAANKILAKLTESVCLYVDTVFFRFDPTLQGNIALYTLPPFWFW